MNDRFINAGSTRTNSDLIKMIMNIRHKGSADKVLARPGRKQATATEDFDVHISYL